MKVRREARMGGFAAFDIILTVESEEEAQALYAIFNYGPNTDLLPRGQSLAVNDLIGGKFGVSRAEAVIANEVTYRDFYRPKAKLA